MLELEYEQSQKEILKEMMRIYIDQEIINLEPHEFDDFISREVIVSGKFTQGMRIDEQDKLRNGILIHAKIEKR